MTSSNKVAASPRGAKETHPRGGFASPFVQQSSPRKARHYVVTSWRDFLRPLRGSDGVAGRTSHGLRQGLRSFARYAGWGTRKISCERVAGADEVAEEGQKPKKTRRVAAAPASPARGIGERNIGHYLPILPKLYVFAAALAVNKQLNGGENGAGVKSRIKARYRGKEWASR